MAGCMNNLGRFFSNKRHTTSSSSTDDSSYGPDLLTSTSTQKRFSESLLRQLSAVQTPELILQQQEAMVNLIVFKPIHTPAPYETEPPAGVGGYSFTGYGRLKSMAASRQQQQSPGSGDGLEPRASTRFDWSFSRKALETAIALEQQTERGNGSSGGGGYGFGYNDPYGQQALMMQEHLLIERLHKLVRVIALWVYSLL